MGYSICNIAKYGRSTGDIQSRKMDPDGYVEKLKKQPKAFIVSMGGIDFLGSEVLSWLGQRASGDHDPANAPRYIVETEFARRLQIAKLNYEILLSDIQAYAPKTKLIVQTYSYACIPVTPVGPFLGQYFKAKGFEPADPAHRPLCQAIIRLVLDRFFNMLQSVALTHGNMVKIVDFRQALRPSDIRDEIHPHPKVAAAMAKSVVPVLKAWGITPKARRRPMKRVKKSK